MDAERGSAKRLQRHRGAAILSCMHGGGCDSSPVSRWAESEQRYLRDIARSFLRRQSWRTSKSADDVVHEVYVRLREGLPAGYRIDDRNHFLCLFCMHMRWWWLEEQRKTGRRRQRELNWARAREPLSDQKVLSALREDLELLEDALLALERANRLDAVVVQLRILSYCTIQQVAESLGMPYGTAKQRWSRAAAFLVKSLCDHERDDQVE